MVCEFLNLCLALAAQMTAYRIEYAQYHVVHYVVSLYVEVCLFGFDAKLNHLFHLFLMQRDKMRHLFLKQFYIVLDPVAELLQRICRVSYIE